MSNMGWICPRCNKVHAPDVKWCRCQPLIGGPQLPPYNIPSSPAPMPICGCTGPCGNSACPHRAIHTCAVSNTYGAQ